MDDEKYLGEESSILDEMSETEVSQDYTGMVGTAIICLSMYIPIWIPEMAPYVGWIIILGFAIVFAPNLLKWKETSIHEFIGSETYFGDGDIYEQFIVEDIMTVVAAAEPFPFAEYCYEEEDIEQFINAVGGTAQLDPEAIEERITIAVAKRAAEITARPSIIKTLKFSLRNNRFVKNRFTARWHKEDTSTYKLEEDSEE